MNSYIFTSSIGPYKESEVYSLQNIESGILQIQDIWHKGQLRWENG